jgi:hypothetical protein
MVCALPATAPAVKRLCAATRTRRGCRNEMAMDRGVGFSCRDNPGPYWGAAGPHVGVALIHPIWPPPLAASFIYSGLI